MSGIYKIVGALCITGYVMGVLMNFSGANYTGKAIRLVAALYIIAAVFNPENRFDFDLTDYYAAGRRRTRQDSEEYIISQAGANVEEKIKTIFKEKNISYETVKVHIYKQTEKLYIDHVEILGADKSQREYIIEILKDVISRDSIIWGE